MENNTPNLESNDYSSFHVSMVILHSVQWTFNPKKNNFKKWSWLLELFFKMEKKTLKRWIFSILTLYREWPPLPCSAARQRLLIECFRRAIIIAARSNASNSLFSAPHSSWSLAWKTELALGLFFISSQTCSIGLKSGDFAGQRSTGIPSWLVGL